MREYEELTIAPGLFTEATGRTARGRYKDGDHVRFRDGLPEKIGGFAQAITSKARGVPRSSHDWVSLDTQKWSAVGTERRLYLVNGVSLYNITPIRQTGTLTDPFTTTAASSIVTVTDTNHGVVIGDIVTFTTGVDVGGISLVGEYDVIDVIDADTYTIEVLTSATTSDTGGGSVDYIYEINATQYSVGGNLVGYGRGGYGSGGYGVRLTTQSAPTPTSQLRTWSLDNFGEDLIASPRGGAVYLWDRTNGPSTRAQLITTAPSKNLSVFVSPEDRVVVCAGTEPIDQPGVLDPMLVRWSDVESFDFIPTSLNVAGDFRLANGSVITTYCRSRRQTILFTDSTLYSMQFVGDGFGFDPLGESISVVSPDAAQDVNGIIYYMGAEGFYVYDGTVRPLQCEVHTKVFGPQGLNTTYGAYVVSAVFTEFSEVTWWYTSAGNTDNNMYVTYNYKYNLWYYGTGRRSTVVGGTKFFGYPYGWRQDGMMIKHEIGSNDVDANGQPIPLNSFLVSYDVEIPNAGSRVLHVSSCVPDFQELTGSGTVRLVGRKFPQDPYTEDTGQRPVDTNTDRIDLRMRARQVALYWEQLGFNSTWRMGSWRLKVNPHGRR